MNPSKSKHILKIDIENEYIQVKNARRFGKIHFAETSVFCQKDCQKTLPIWQIGLNFC